MIYKQQDGELDAHTFLSGLDPFGTVSGGFIKITTKIAAYDIGVLYGSSTYRTLDNWAHDFHIMLDYESSQTHYKVTFALIALDELNCFGLLLQQSRPETFQRLGIFYTMGQIPNNVYNGFRRDTVIIT